MIIKVNLLLKLDTNYFSFVTENLEEFNLILPIININLNEESEKNYIEKEITILIENELKKNINISAIDIMHILFGINIEKKMNYYR